MASKNVEPKTENVHKGHRKRVKENYLKCGLDGFQHHEILELLLFFGIPMKDTNEIAHELINTFGSFSNVLNASFENLVKIKGMTENAALLITLIAKIMPVYFSDVSTAESLDNMETITKYFSVMYAAVRNEELKVCCLDNDLKVISCETIEEGDINSVAMDSRKIVMAALKHNTTNIILAHNHPNSSPVPSSADVSSTRKVKMALDIMGIKLLDHIIVGKNGVISMQDCGYFESFR